MFEVGRYLLVGLGKLALRVEGCNGRGKLGHGVHIGGEVVQQGDHVAGQLGPAGPLRGEPTHLLLGGDFPGEQQPEETLGKRLLAAGCFWQQLLALWDCIATEPGLLC